MKKSIFKFTAAILICVLFAGCGQASQISVEAPEGTAAETAADVQAAANTPADVQETADAPHSSASQTPSPQGEGLVQPENTPEPEITPEETQEPEDTPEPEITPEETPEPEITEEPAPSVDISELIVWNDPWEYSYSDMVYDAQLITQVFPGLVTVDSLAVTADGREILHFVAGNPDAEKKVFINAGTHAREYITCQLVMKQLVEYLRSIAAHESYHGVSYDDMWEQVAVHVVPMINPDGVSISQFGLEGIQNEEILQTVYNIAAMDGVDITGYYLDRWKANALGTDINRNYDAYWEEYNDPAGHPSSDHYKGEYPGSSTEAAAMIKLTEDNGFLRTISYHAQGGLIYWNFANIDAIYNEAYAFASQLSAVTGYPLDSNFEIIDPAGYSDWGIYRCQIPSVTMEVGYGTCPYLNEQFQTIWQENIVVFETTVLSVME